MLFTAGFMAFATFTAKALGQVRDSLMAAYFGTGIEADAFMLASKIPTTLFDVVIGGVISASFIPIFNSILQREDKKTASEFANKFITLILLATVLIAIFGIVFAGQLVRFMGPDASPETSALATQLTAIMFPMIIFTGIAFSFVGILQSYGEYNIPSIISLVSNIAIIVYYILFGKKFGVTGLAVTMIIAWSLQVIIQIPSLIKLKFRYRPNFNFKDRHLKNAILLAIPMLVSTWVQPLYTLINARFASGMEGAYSSLEYANRLYLIVTGVFSFIVTNLIFPKLAKANAGDNSAEAKALVMTSLKAIIIVIMPLMMGIIILARPVTAIIYEHGALETSASDIVANALRCYAVGMIFLAINEVASKTFFSMRQSLIPMLNAIISMIFNIVLVSVIFRFINGDATTLTGGLALAAAAGSLVNATLNTLALFRRMPDMAKKRDLLTVIKVLIATAVMAAAVFGVYMLIGTRFEGTFGNILICGISGITGIIVYGVSVIILRVDEITALLPKRFRKGESL